MEAADTYAELVQSTPDLSADMKFLEGIGFRLDQIFPSDDPAVALMSGHSMHIRLDRNADVPAGNVQLVSMDVAKGFSDQEDLIAPNGTVYKFHLKTRDFVIPPAVSHFEVRRLQDNDSWVIGRAGMQYRDLIPDRLGGSIIASHIRIPEGGPVPDMVHYHTIGFQLIFCYKGWVKVAYEDQGEPFTLNAGDCVTQPPEIRHRVLEVSDHLEVIEIGVPAVHMTTIDHELELPTKTFNPEREFQGQRFCHHLQEGADWKPWRIPGFDSRNTGIDGATKGIASVHVARLNGSEVQASHHDCEILFSFVMQGNVELQAEQQQVKQLTAGDTFVIPPRLKYQFQNGSADLEILEVALPGSFETTIHPE